jgi:hypothetical protein
VTEAERAFQEALLLVEHDDTFVINGLRAYARAIWDARGEWDAQVCEDLHGRLLSGGERRRYWERQALPTDCASAIRAGNLGSKG